MRTSVAVLRGGTSGEYGLSLKTGTAMMQALPEDKYEVRDIFIDKKGFWNARGAQVDPARALSQVDVVLNGIHGGIGEDGTIQRILQRAGVPFAGSNALQSSLSLNKIRAHEVLENLGVRMPSFVSFSLEEDMTTADMARSTFANFGPPYVVKPPTEGASIGIRIVPTILELPDAIGDILDAYGSVLVEQFVKGELVSVGLVEQFREQELYALPPAEILFDEGTHLHIDHHVNATSHTEVPSRFSIDEKKDMMDLARQAHRGLGLSHASRADLILTPRGPVLLEINSVPGLYPGSSFPAMLEAVGSSVSDYLENSIQFARR